MVVQLILSILILSILQNSLPVKFLQSLQNLKNFDEAAFLKVHQSGEQVVSVRCNPAKIKADQLFFGDEISKEPIPWSSQGFYLSQRPSFTTDPIFHAGAYYVQEASSMFLEEVLKQITDLQKPLKVLDLCAAPGGKSTLLQSLINDKSLLISNEIIKGRASILAENITKWGAENVIVTNNDPKDFERLKNYFDVIVVDAPCSGSGLFRKDNDAITEWSEQNVQMCSERQQKILTDVLPALKDGGKLIYSTCSYAEIEDESIVDWLTADKTFKSLQINVPANWNIVETMSPQQNGYGYRFYPDKLKGEGFFIAAFIKGEAAEQEWLTDKYKSKSERLVVKEIDNLRPYLKDTENYFFIKQKEEVIAMPLHLEFDLATIQFALYIKKAGVKLGSIIRNELIPDHELALSALLHLNVPRIEVDRDTALQYLRRQDFKIITNLRGWVLITHQQLPLGWIKILPNRINNYYPKEWRIFNK